MSQRVLPGEIYRHYKGKIVLVLGVVIAAPTEIFQLLGESNASHPSPCFQLRDFAIARWTDETQGGVKIFKAADGTLWLSPSLRHFDPLALYACSGDLWVRPVSEFLGEASPGVSRFTRVGAKFLDAKNPASGLKELSPLPLHQELGIDD